MNIGVRQSRRNGHDGTLVTIHDRGAGIPKSVQDQVSTFFHNQGAERGWAGPLGMKTLVLRHHGSIRFGTSTRKCASGTTFQLFLPIDALKQAALEAPGI